MNILILILGLIGLAERVIKWILIQQFFQKAKLEAESFLPLETYTISILQPILSGDPTLWDCLSNNLALKTPYQLEFIWLIDENDPVAQAGCHQLIETYPDVKVKLISLPPSPNQISPKMFKLIAGLKEATGNIIAVLDDDTMLPNQAFDQCLAYLEKPEIGVAFGLPYYVNFSNFWSTLVSSVVNGNNLLTYIPYTYLINPFTINGMFFVIKREVLEKVDGFATLDKFIVDDYAIAQHFRKQGYQLAQTPVCHGISTQIQDSTHYFNLITRWFIFPQASILKSSSVQELIVFYLMAFLPTLFPFLVFLYTLFFPSLYGLIYGLIYFGLNYALLSNFNQNYLRNATPKTHIIVLILVQILLPIHIIISLFLPRNINWRGHIMQLTEEGGFEFIQRRDSV
ncbi:Nucleoside-diphosphate-sugar epimerase [Planktothrix tepida]|uniref:Nucleoside-diphosphate-sugar epimerase n=1 Tax=Planktothrix tepida PCC 9214 TaxID=671072 RepID=A0A1J1LIG7_9CYAN|nr:glycosyltransferase family 2 protein [Planktothrix tepida]CAD5983251.1 Nucleoside-diphosphate-sugar epimerase [Planktothrix tepida]CUR32312.1 Nucleoside-diphosphate-sugar epimerase [Planktothrix tepida PCC 9214]